MLPLREDTIYFADSADVLPRLPTESFQLIYIDPPFNTGGSQRRDTLATFRDEDGDRVGFKGRRYRTELVSTSSYRDRFDNYLGFVEPRMHEARRLLTPSGTFYFHIDYREAHYCKLLLDVCGVDYPKKTPRFTSAGSISKSGSQSSDV